MLKVVIGSSGTGFKYWDDKFQSSRRIGLLATHREFAMNYVSNNADYAYLTSSDPAASNPTDIANEMNSYVDNRIPTQIIVDRKNCNQTSYFRFQSRRFNFYCWSR